MFINRFSLFAFCSGSINMSKKIELKGKKGKKLPSGKTSAGKKKALEIKKPIKTKTTESASRIAKSVHISHKEKRGGDQAGGKASEFKMPPQEILSIVENAMCDEVFVDYISKNIGSQANGLLKRLLEGPQKDEALAEKAEIKLNEVRRSLNLLNRHGIVRYDVKRDNTGWLTFEWHVDYVAFSDFYKTLNKKTESRGSPLPEGCNDFFVCVVCSKQQSLVYPFDIAYEKSFKCNCGKNLEAITRKAAEELIKT